MIFLTGCSTNNNKISQSELFEKKKECFTYKDDLQKGIDKSQNEIENAD